MSYEKQTWASGDVITAEKLNHIEDGVVVAEPFIVNLTYTQSGGSSSTPPTLSDFVADKTYDEIFAAYTAGRIVILRSSASDSPNSKADMLLDAYVNGAGHGPSNISFKSTVIGSWQDVSGRVISLSTTTFRAYEDNSWQGKIDGGTIQE